MQKKERKCEATKKGCDWIWVEFDDEDTYNKEMYYCFCANCGRSRDFSLDEWS